MSCFVFLFNWAMLSRVCYFAIDLRHRFISIFLQAFKGSSLSGRSLFYASKVKGD